MPIKHRIHHTKSFALTVTVCGGLLWHSAVSAYDNNSSAVTESKRIEVYSLSQNYWDVQYGDTLGSIAHHLLPNNPLKREALQQDILHLNPQAFINGQPEKLLAGKRLWLPGYMKQADSKTNPSTMDVETYSWGNIKRPK
jgi:Tfp pilus assembly protein FimV